jgi:hypothetical protein
MNTLSKDGLKILLGKDGGPCLSVSIYMTTEKTGSGARQNSIRLKNLLRDAEERLVEHGLRRPEAKKLLAPASALPDDDLFWRQQSEGLAIFISKDVFLPYHVPLNFKESVAVADRFHIKPLLPFFTGDGVFYILALSQNKVRLLQCSHYGAREIDLTGIVPTSIAEVNHHETERQQSHHTGRSGNGESTVFTGQNIGDQAKNNILRYFQQVNKGVHHQLLKEENAPLILAGVDYLHPIYRTANTYPHLFDKGITGNPDEWSAKELQKRAWEILEPFFEKSLKEAAAEYRQLAGSGHTSKDILEIVPSAYEGGVELLFVALGVQEWGTFDLKSNSIDLHENLQSCDVDLLDFAAAYTIMHGGTVYAVKSEDVPGGTPAAAVFRHERHSPASVHRAASEASELY